LAMPDDSPTPPPTSGSSPYAHQIGARYLDARARGIGHEAAVREAAALLWALRPSLSPRQAREVTLDLIGAVAL
jgi:hypothetical protein